MMMAHAVVDLTGNDVAVVLSMVDLNWNHRRDYLIDNCLHL
jgi:hypothetical protein